MVEQKTVNNSSPTSGSKTSIRYSKLENELRSLYTQRNNYKSVKLGDVELIDQMNNAENADDFINSIMKERITYE